MNELNRRMFLRSSALVAGGGFFGMEGLLARAEAARTAYPFRRGDTNVPGGYGALKPTPAANTGEIILALPEGFSYRAFGATGAMMADGNKTPSDHDGMAAFPAPNGKIRLVRNHEISEKPGIAFLGASGKGYDEKASGGVTTLIIDAETRKLERDFLSLSGTHNNCAGGATPWGTWISCEETTIGTKAGFAQEHGYCFEVPAAGEGVAEAVPLKAMGRFVHEAIAVDPKTGIVYLTEDRKNAGFYRFLPKVKGKLAEGGRLQMLAMKGRDVYDTRRNQKAGDSFETRWVEIEDVDPKGAESYAFLVYKEGIAKGAATFARLEGCWYGRGSIFTTATNGGDKEMGQVWRFDPHGANDGLLTLIFESPHRDVLAMPDNVCVSPHGGLVLCEDSEEANQHVRGLSPKGALFDLARNIIPGKENQEFAGATFSPDGKTLFVNIQTPGVTLALWGPWERGTL